MRIGIVVPTEIMDEITHFLSKEFPEIEAIRTSLGHADRHAVQQALMPFHHLLPPHLRGLNARIGEER